MFAYEYQVTGSWVDPKVFRVGAPELAIPGLAPAAPAAAEGAPETPPQ
jgi:hypothetical protein